MQAAHLQAVPKRAEARPGGRGPEDAPTTCPQSGRQGTIPLARNERRHRRRLRALGHFRVLLGGRSPDRPFSDLDKGPRARGMSAPVDAINRRRIEVVQGRIKEVVSPGQLGENEEGVDPDGVCSHQRVALAPRQGCQRRQAGPVVGRSVPLMVRVLLHDPAPGGAWLALYSITTTRGRQCRSASQTQ